MAIREILVVPNPVLKQVSQPVDKVDDDLRALMDDMLETMYDAPGIGLAAIQIGVPKRVIVMDLAGPDEEKAPRYFVNPEILWASEDTAPYEEGCLSIPEIYDEVERPARLLHAPAVHHHHLVGQRHRLDLVVGDVDHRRAEPVVKVGELRPHAHAQLGVEVGERLVEEQRIGIDHHRASESDALLLAAGE